MPKAAVPLPDRPIYHRLSLLSYIASFWAHSWDESAAFWETSRKQIVIQLLLLSLGAFGWALYRGLDYAVNEVLVGIGFTVGPPVLAAALMYLWGVVKAPYSLHKRGLVQVAEISARSGFLPRNGVYTFELVRKEYTPEQPDLVLEFISPGPLILRNFGDTACLIQIKPIGSISFDIVPDLHYSECKEFDAKPLISLLESVSSDRDRFTTDIEIDYFNHKNAEWTRSERLVYVPSKRLAYIEHGSARPKPLPRKEL